MATPMQEVQLLLEGIQADAPSKGSFALNMLRHGNAWHVRKGFGQVTQFDTTMSTPSGGSAAVWGYTKHLGSRLIKTNFGNLQMLSVLLTTANTGNMGSSSFAAVTLDTPVVDIYCVSIYDLTTNERFEVPLYTHTSQLAAAESFHSSKPPGSGRADAKQFKFWTDDLKGMYQTDGNVWGQTNWVDAKDEFFYFEEHGDILYFGNTATGLWAYIPASFNKVRPVSLDRVNTHERGHAYSESSIITPVVLSPGINPEAYDYLRTADLPNPTDVAVWENRMVYAAGRTLFFSDPGFPSAITANNSMSVPTEETITAIAEQNATLFIFTDNETWVYQPSVGDVVTLGRLTRLSQSVGCIGANAVHKLEGQLVWVDTSNVFMSSGDMAMRPIGDNIRPFFEDGIPNPLTSYFLQSGGTELPAGVQQPLTTIRLRREGVCLSYSSSLRALFMCVPGLNGAMVFTEGNWSWWTFESSATANARPGVVANITSPWVLVHQDDMLVIGGPDVQALTDDAELVDGTDLDNDTTSRSFYILDYGRGGAIDRSVYDEDDRKVTGRWQRLVPAGDDVTWDGGVFIDDPIRVPLGYNFPSGAETATTDNFIWAPFDVVPPVGVWNPAAGTPQGIDYIQLDLSFDATRWTPVFTTEAGTAVDFSLPTERLGSAPGWSVQVFSDSGYSSASQSGGYMRILFRGTSVSNTWTHHPKLNLNEERHNPLIYIPFKRRGAQLADDCSGMGWGKSEAILGDMNSDPDINRDVSLFVFDRWDLGSGSVCKEDSAAQPVDWAYKSTNVGLDGGRELKFRGSWTNLLSHGSGADKLSPAWVYGLFNTLAGSDRKEWITQVVDASHTPPAVRQDDTSSPFAGKGTLRTRVQAASGALVDKVFQDGSSNITWGDKADADTGNLLIGDEDTSEISVSMSVKGQSFSLMKFGYMVNRAERLAFEGIKAVFRVVGGRRRKGR